MIDTVDSIGKKQIKRRTKNGKRAKLNTWKLKLRHCLKMVQIEARQRPNPVNLPAIHLGRRHHPGSASCERSRNFAKNSM